MLHDNAISTHTPARGVTDGAGRERYRSYNFYSHAREGRDPFSVSRYCRKIVDFYSHAREGRDYSDGAGGENQGISTHTPARGVTLTDLLFDGIDTISTHTPARGVTRTA